MCQVLNMHKISSISKHTKNSPQFTSSDCLHDGRQRRYARSSGGVETTAVAAAAATAPAALIAWMDRKHVLDGHPWKAT